MGCLFSVPGGQAGLVARPGIIPRARGQAMIRFDADLGVWYDPAERRAELKRLRLRYGAKSLRASAACCPHCGQGAGQCPCTPAPEHCPCCRQAVEQFGNVRDLREELERRLDLARSRTETTEGLECLSKSLGTGAKAGDAGERRFEMLRAVHHHDQATAKESELWAGLARPCRCGHVPRNLHSKRARR
jgi:hypothetical protein